MFALLPYENKLSGNVLVSALIFFNNLNLFIAICEICLGIHILFIKEDYKRRFSLYGTGTGTGTSTGTNDKLLEGLLNWVNMPITIGQVFHGKTWAQMWSTYSLLDPSYQNHESFGFFIDVGNGWTTIPPCLLLNYVMVMQYNHNHDHVMFSPLVVGCIVIASYWQMLYGTIIYFFSFLFNKRYEGKGVIANVIVFFANIVWMVFPGIAIYVAFHILQSKSFDILTDSY